MTKIIYTDETRPSSLSQFEREQVYNGIDSSITHEIDEILEDYMDSVAKATYEFEMRQHKAALRMMLRGVRVNLSERKRMIQECEKELAYLEGWLNEMAVAIWGNGLNPRSPLQLQRFFYDTMRIKPVTKRDKLTGEQKRTTDREAMDKIKERNYFAQPIVSTILEARDLSKTIGTLYSDVRAGRFYTSYNVAGTVTGRWSSKKSAFGDGSNTQNITKDLREMFIADEGMMLGCCDLSQAESFAVAYVSGDENYIEACLSGDLHTFCCTLIWNALDWPTDMKAARAMAEEKYFRHFSRRDLAKRAGHLSNYYGKPVTMSQRLFLPIDICRNFQNAYFTQFKGIQQWHAEVQRKLLQDRQLITAMGRRRWCFDRLNSDDTLRKFIAQEPQSLVADIINTGILRVVEEQQVEVLLQVHDCLVFQFPEYQYDVARRVQQLLHVEVPIRGRVMTIPADLKVGYDWKNLVELREVSKLKRQAYNLLELTSAEILQQLG